MKKMQLFSQVRFLDKLLFTKHLSVMIQSGISITEALDTIAQQTKSSTFKAIIEDIAGSIRNGHSLSQALKRHPAVFDHFYVSLVEISEESGTLEKNLQFLAIQLNKDYQLRKKIQAALLYPMIVLIAMLLVGGGLSIFVLPKLIDLFSSLNVPLPWPTLVLLFVAHLITDHQTILFGGIIGLIVIVRMLISLPLFKKIWDKTVFSIPVFGSFIQYGQLASLCRNMGIMLQSGLTIKTALQVQYAVTDNLLFKSYIGRLQKATDKGKSLEDEFNSEDFSQFSPIAIKMISVGEKSGKLDEIFMYLANFFEDEVDDTAKNFTTLLEPILLLVVGLAVGFVAVAIISPIYQVTGAIKP